MILQKFKDVKQEGMGGCYFLTNASGVFREYLKNTWFILQDYTGDFLDNHVSCFENQLRTFKVHFMVHIDQCL